MKELTAKEEAFAQAYVLGGCSDATAAWRIAHPDNNAAVKTQWNSAYKMLKREEVKARIDELKGRAATMAEEKFTISVEQRLKWLQEVALAGLAIYHDQGGNERRENLAATRAAVQTLNEMLGTGLDSKDDNKNITVVIKRDV